MSTVMEGTEHQSAFIDPGTALEKGHLARRNQQVGAAKLSYEQALTAYQAIFDDQGEAETLSSIGALAIEAQQYQDAVNWLERAGKCWQQLGDIELLSKTLARLGHAQHRLSRLVEARRCFDEAMALAKQMSDPSTLAFTLVHASELEAEQHHATIAESYLESAYRIYRENDDRPGQLQALNAWGEMLEDTQEFERATPCFAQSLGVCYEIKAENIDAENQLPHQEYLRALLGLARSCIREKDLTEATQYLQQAEILISASHQTLPVVKALLALGDAQHDTQHESSAHDSYLKAEALALQGHEKELIGQAAERIAKLRSPSASAR